MNMKPIKRIMLLLVLVGVCLGFKPMKSTEYILYNHIYQEKDASKWLVPASADSLINPGEIDEETLAEGMLIYKRNCRSCHGRKGNGKGVEAADLSTVVTDFTKPDFLKQSDGAIFWKIAEGREMEKKEGQKKNDMEGFKKDLDEEEIWLLVNYIKTFVVEADK